MQCWANDLSDFWEQLKLVSHSIRKKMLKFKVDFIFVVLFTLLSKHHWTVDLLDLFFCDLDILTQNGGSSQGSLLMIGTNSL